MYSAPNVFLHRKTLKWRKWEKETDCYLPFMGFSLSTASCTFLSLLRMCTVCHRSSSRARPACRLCKMHENVKIHTLIWAPAAYIVIIGDSSTRNVPGAECWWNFFAAFLEGSELRPAVTVHSVMERLGESRLEAARISSIIWSKISPGKCHSQ